ncbi:hypothetical protein TNIN_296881 [Trichonephila inaurata madagascariensis]|uniref:Uncharacterized protein n=1 Tax=Trichonephila inaurata madagascariensis TaxID=2747483 RepID=A0A8X7CJ29_9ARAC|nr:hypothetical protein TNIN_296881 [Trichonephila inaurata madagascariensis]
MPCRRCFNRLASSSPVPIVSRVLQEQVESREQRVQSANSKLQSELPTSSPSTTGGVRISAAPSTLRHSRSVICRSCALNYACRRCFNRLASSSPVPIVSRVLQEQVESLESSVSSANSKLQSELSNLKSKYHSEVSDLSSTVDSTSQQISDLQKLCKRQANQITGELQLPAKGIRNILLRVWTFRWPIRMVIIHLNFEKFDGKMNVVGTNLVIQPKESSKTEFLLHRSSPSRASCQHETYSDPQTSAIKPENMQRVPK